MDAKEFLEQPKKIDSMIMNKLLEIEQWRTLAKKTTAQMGGERVQTSSNQQSMAEAIAIYSDIERELIDDVMILRDTKKDVIKVIEKLKVSNYDLIHKHYIQYIELADIAVIYQKSYSWVTTKHGRALQAVQKILDGRR